MNSKESILQLLDQELTNLISPYETSMEKLEEENLQLKRKIDKLQEEKRKLEFSLSGMHENSFFGIDNQKLLNHLRLLSESINYELIDKLFLTSTVENSTLLLLHLQDFLNLGETDKAMYILDMLQHNPNPLFYSKKHFMSLMKKSFDIIMASSEDENISEEVLASLLILLTELSDTVQADFVKSYLQTHYLTIADNVLFYNEPRMAALLLKLLLQYNLETELKKVLINIIEEEWNFFDYNVTKEEFTVFLWYTYLDGLDSRLTDKADGSLRFLKNPNKELDLYNFVYNCINSKSVSDREKLSVLLDHLKKSPLFSEKEISLIVKKVNEMLQPYMTAKPVKTKCKLSKYTEHLYVIDGSEVSSLSNLYLLAEEQVMLPLYGHEKAINPVRYEKAVILIPKRGKYAFINRSLLKAIQDKHPRYVLKVNDYFTKTESKNTNLVRTSPKAQENEKQDDSLLNENSALKLMGYQITGLTRQKRWHILEQAVPKLGLKKVVSTIAYNVRLRKGQKNGIEKYSYALSEWEYDLKRLKKQYYKNNFTWPNV